MAMEKIILTVNPGSTSKRYSLFRDDELLLSIRMEKLAGLFGITLSTKAGNESSPLTSEDYDNSIEYVSRLLQEKNLIADKSDINFVAVRVVAPGDFFAEHRFIDDDYIEKLEQVKDLALLHTASVLNEIQKVSEVFDNAKIYAVSDSALHNQKGESRSLYAIDKDDSYNFGIKKIGYHGVSVSSILRKIKALNINGEKVIICHLGGGSSITAIKSGKSTDTTMGFSPLEGLVMATRSGSIDASVVLELMKKKKLSIEETEKYLNQQCGLLGLSKSSPDVSELLKKEEAGDEDAKIALQILVESIQKHIGMMVAVLSGVDAIVFTGAIGERSFIIRERVLENFAFLGVKLDKSINNRTVEIDQKISTDESLPVYVLNTDEELELAKTVLEL
jgi:acetate kinase